MLKNLPTEPADLLKWTWSEIEPHYKDLQTRELNETNVNEWLKDWSNIARRVYDIYSRLSVATTIDTTDQAAEEAYKKFLDEIFPNSELHENNLKQKFLASKLEPKGFEIALRNMRAEAELFHEENLPLMNDERKTGLEYDKVMGAQTVQWEGEEKTISQMYPILLEKDRAKRDAAYQLIAKRRYQDREAIGSIWGTMMTLRKQISDNADKSDYRAYAWQQKLRFDYSPADSKAFDKSIEEVIVPAAARIRERQRKRLGIETLRPWDTEVDTLGDEPIRPYKTMDELYKGTRILFDKVDPEIGKYFQIMVDEGLLDLENRKGKGPGGYCTSFPVSNRPFIFMNAVGTHSDVNVLLHEGGHSFHVFETANIELIHNINTPMEFNEVASMAMEYLGGKFLLESGMYTPAEAARAEIQHLESSLIFWPYMAVVDEFQHWIYENHDLATNFEACNKKWVEIYNRYMRGLDWSGLEEFQSILWQRQLHIIQIPFYYVEYGLAQLGAAQIWANSLDDYEGAVRAYRKALSLGGTVSLPELFAAAGAKFSFDTATIKRIVDLMEKRIEELEKLL